MTSYCRAGCLAALSVALMAATALPANAAMVFNRIASFPVYENNQDAEATSSEIIAVSEDAMTLVYSDSPAGGVGFIDITDPKAPKAAGWVGLDGEPTSVAVIGGKAYVGVNTSESYTNPSGKLAVVDLESHEVSESCELGGQPDSVARAKDGSMIAIAIENERDEDAGDGGLPQMPAGFAVVFDVSDGAADCDNKRVVDLTGLADVGGEDPEPEYVDFNSDGLIALTMQENNYIALIDGKSGEVTSHFSAGSVDLTGIDTEDDGKLDFTSSKMDVPREPDTVQWIDDDRFVIANEGDWKGGTRSFSIFNKNGDLEFDSGPNTLDLMAASVGHYPDGRSDNKGVEPEGLEVAKFGDDTFIFVLEERSSLVAVYKDTGADPEFVQLLPSGIAPEGSIAIPERNLFVSANEDDLREDGLMGSHVMIFELQDAEPTYPTIVADKDADGNQIGFVALSGLAADPSDAGKLYAVSDSFLSNQPSIYTIDATQKPARITAQTVVTRDGAIAQKLDLEGITSDGEGGFWLSSEGRTDRVVPHALYHVDADGAIDEEVGLPTALMDNEIRFGMEGVTAVGTGDDMTLWIAMQREWRDDEKGFVKLVSYTPASGEWGAVSYPLENPTKGWVGLSEITAHDGNLYIVERDNQIGANAVLKKLFKVSLDGLEPAELGSELPVVEKDEVHDFVPDLKSFNGYVVDKVEGFAIDTSGEGFVVTDNDGVDDSSGETFFWSIGEM